MVVVYGGGVDDVVVVVGVDDCRWDRGTRDNKLSVGVVVEFVLRLISDCCGHGWSVGDAKRNLYVKNWKAYYLRPQVVERPICSAAICDAG